MLKRQNDMQTGCAKWMPALAWRGWAGAVAALVAMAVVGSESALAQVTPAATSTVTTEAPPTVPAPPPGDRERGIELYQRAHDALAAGLPELAAIRFETACAFNEGRSCFNIGLDLEGRAVKPNAPIQLRAATLAAYRKVCDLAFERGCVATGRLLLDEQWGKPDPAQGLALIERACRRGETDGCDELSQLLYTGKGMPQDLPRAARLFRQVCDTAGRPNSCFNYGLMAERGRGIGRDAALGRHYYRIACRAGSLAGCHNLAVDYAEQDLGSDRLMVARGLLRKGCDRGHLTSCTSFGQLIRERQQPSDNYAEAVAALTKACDGKDGLACRILGNMAHERVGVPGRDRAANRFYERSCKLGYGPGCYNLGLVYWTGYKVRANAETAIAWFGEGCRLRSASSCAGAYLATANLPAGNPLSGQDMAARWLAQGEAIDPGDNLVQTVREAYESKVIKPKAPRR